MPRWRMSQDDLDDLIEFLKTLKESKTDRAIPGLYPSRKLL